MVRLQFRLHSIVRRAYTRFHRIRHLMEYVLSLTLGNCFVVHRKLLRRRHVRKEQMRRQREAAKQQRDSVKRTRMDHHVTDDMTINTADSFSDLDVHVSMSSPCNNTARDHTEQFILGINRTNNINTFANFISTPLPFSPLRSTRRKLVVNS
jgi:hypothetical protein